MKNKFILSIVSVFVVLAGNAQLVSGTLLPGTAPNSVIFALNSTAAFSQPFTNVQFVLQIPNTASPTPRVQIKNNILSAYIPSYNFNEVNSSTPIAFSNEGGYFNYLFSSVILGGTPYNFTTSTFNVLEVEILDGPVVPATVRFAQLPNGGTFGQHNFYIETNTGDHTNELNMFYGGGATNDPLGYGGYSYVPLPGVILPVIWLSFTAVKQGNDAVLNWKVGNEDKSDHYEIMRSTDGINFSAVTSVNKSGSGIYNYTDLGSISLATVIYYRIKQVDVNGKIGYSEIRTISTDKKDFSLKVYPNPVSKGFYMDLNLPDNEQGMVKLNLFSSNGQLVAGKEITRSQAANYYFDISDKQLASGQYSLQVMLNDKMVATKMLTINQ